MWPGLVPPYPKCPSPGLLCQGSRLPTGGPCTVTLPSCCPSGPSAWAPYSWLYPGVASSPSFWAHASVKLLGQLSQTALCTETCGA